MGARPTRRHPSFSIVAILTLALGVGVHDGALQRDRRGAAAPAALSQPGRARHARWEKPRTGRPGRYAPSMADIRAWRTLDSIVSHAGMGRVSGFVPLIVDAGTPERLIVAEASEDFLETYGLRPVLGRSIQSNDTREGAPRRAPGPRVLAARAWRRSEGAGSRPSHRKRGGDDRWRPAARVLQPHRRVASETVPRPVVRDARLGHAGDRALASRRNSGAGRRGARLGDPAVDDERAHARPEPAS